MDPRRRSRAWPLLLFAALAQAACSASPEASILEDFFQASRLHDGVTLGSFATTSFNPETDGIVQSFDIVAVGALRRVPMPLTDYGRTLGELSLARVEPPIGDVTTYNGELVSKDVRLDATVRTPAGTVKQQLLAATLTRVRLPDRDGREIVGRWIVTAVSASEGRS
jgi:hypothetical protein